MSDVVVFVEVPSRSRSKNELEEASVETRGYGNRADVERILGEARARAAG